MLQKIRKWIAEHTPLAIFIGAVVLLFFIGITALVISNWLDKKEQRQRTIDNYLGNLQRIENKTEKIIKEKDHNIQTNIGNNLYGNND